MTAPSTEIQVATPAALSSFGGRSEIKELAERLRIMMPAAQKFSAGEALAVAQVARAHDLDPFNGEVWGIKSETTWYGVMVGIKGLRKSARREAFKENSNYWTDISQVDPAKYGATKPGSVVYECILRDVATMQAWGKSVNILTTAGVPYKEAVEMLGKCPQTIGIGIADPAEKSKMGLHARARKRAEGDAIKQRYDVSFGPGVFSEGEKMDDAIAMAAEDGENVIDATSSDVTEEAQPETDESSLEQLDALQKEAEYKDACEVIASDGSRYGDATTDHLQKVAQFAKTSPEKKRAAEIILAHRAELKAKEAMINQQLGF